MNEENLINKIRELENRILEVEQRKTTFVLGSRVLDFLKIKRGTKALLGIIVLPIVLSVIVYASTVTKPNTFSDGDIISASQVNSNFDTLYTLVNGNISDTNISTLDASKIATGVFNVSRIPDIDASKVTTGVLNITRVPDIDASKITSGTINNSILPTSANIFFPDGLNGTIINAVVKAGTSYTVPSGKTLYILSTSYDILIGTDSFMNDKSQVGVFGENTTITSAAGANQGFTGVLVNKGVTVINDKVRSGTSYTVPSGKTLYILSNGADLFIGSDPYQRSYGQIAIFPQNTVITSNVSPMYAGFTGYLR